MCVKGEPWKIFECLHVGVGEREVFRKMSYFGISWRLGNLFTEESAHEEGEPEPWHASPFKGRLALERWGIVWVTVKVQEMMMWDMRATWQWHQPPHWLAGLMQLIWLPGYCPLLPPHLEAVTSVKVNSLPNGGGLFLVKACEYVCSPAAALVEPPYANQTHSRGVVGWLSESWHTLRACLCFYR